MKYESLFATMDDADPVPLYNEMLSADTSACLP
jgi:hypothetical protein